MTLADRLRAPELDVRLAAIAEAGARDTTGEESAALVACLGHERKVVQRRAAEALAALAGRGRPVRELLLPGLAAPSARERWGAAYALALLGPPSPDLLPVLFEALGQDDGDVRWAAATIVVRLKHAPELEERLRGLLGDGSDPQRKMALYCLRDLAEPGEAGTAVVEAVLAALDDPAPAVRLAAMATLPAVTTHRAEAALRVLPLLGDPDLGVRRAATAALGKLGASSPAITEALRAAAGSGDPALERAAERALRLLGS